jgi:hypothetical protein
VYEIGWRRWLFNRHTGPVKEGEFRSLDTKIPHLASNTRKAVMNPSTAHMQTRKTVQDPDQHGFHFIYVTKVNITLHAIVKGPMLQMTKVSNQEKEHSLPRVCAYVCWNLEQDRKGRLVHGVSERWEVAMPEVVAGRLCTGGASNGRRTSPVVRNGCME